MIKEKALPKLKDFIVKHLKALPYEKNVQQSGKRNRVFTIKMGNPINEIVG